MRIDLGDAELRDGHLLDDAEQLFHADDAGETGFDVPLDEGVDAATTLARRLARSGVDARVLAPRPSPDRVALVLAEESTVIAVSARGRAVVIGSLDGARGFSPSP